MIQTIGIVGAGQMGNGIAHVLAVAGYKVLLTDTSSTQINKALRAIEKNLNRQVNRDRLDRTKALDALSRIQTVTDLQELAEVNMVVEAATEDEDIKREILTMSIFRYMPCMCRLNQKRYLDTLALLPKIKVHQN